MKKQNKQSEIVEMLKSGKSAKEVSAELKIPIQYVYNARYLENKKKKVTKKLTKKTVKKPKTISLSSSGKQLLSKIMLEDENERLEIRIENLEHQIIGFRAVISYLEDLAGIRNSQ